MGSRGVEMADVTGTTPAKSEAVNSNLPQWFVDQRNSHHHQAAYLAKIYHLKRDLEIEEETSMKTAIERVGQRGTQNNRNKPQSTIRWRPGTGPSEAMTPRDKQLEIIRRNRQRPLPPVLDPLRGQTILETTPTSSPRRSNSEPKLSTLKAEEPPVLTRKNSFMEAFLNSSLDNNLNTVGRYPDINNTAVTSLMKYITPSASIPNIGRRARPSPADRIMGFSVRKAETPQDFDYKPRGKLYKYTNRLGMRKLVKADSDELDLTPDTYRFDLPYEDDVTRQYKKGDRILPVPTTTPVPLSELSGREFDDAIIKQVKWSNDVVLLRRPKQDQQGHRVIVVPHSQPKIKQTPYRTKPTAKSSKSGGGKINKSFQQIPDNGLSQWQVDETNPDTLPEFDCAICVEDRCSSKGSASRKQIHVDIPTLEMEAVSPVPSKDRSPVNASSRLQVRKQEQGRRSPKILETESVSPLPSKGGGLQNISSQPEMRNRQGNRSAQTR